MASARLLCTHNHFRSQNKLQLLQGIFHSPCLTVGEIAGIHYGNVLNCNVTVRACTCSTTYNVSPAVRLVNLNFRTNLTRTRCHLVARGEGE